MKLTKLAAALTTLLLLGSQAVLAADEATKSEGAKPEAKKAAKKEKAKATAKKAEKKEATEKKEGEAK